MALFNSCVKSSVFLRHCTRLTVSTIQNRRQYADMAFTFATPADVFYNNSKVKQVDVPSFSGSFGILPEHVPTLAVLKPGVITVHEDDSATKKFFVSSGSVTINDDSSVQILAEEAHPLERLDSQMIREGLTRSLQELTAASSDQNKAEAQIAVECYESLQKALE